MGFRNSAMDKLGTLIRKALKSDNYATGVSGWQVTRDGTAEFNGGIFRGSVQVGNPASGEVIIQQGIPAALADYYSAVTITSASIQIIAADGSYFYMLAGNDPGTGFDFAAFGNVKAGGLVAADVAQQWYSFYVPSSDISQINFGDGFHDRRILVNSNFTQFGNGQRGDIQIDGTVLIGVFEGANGAVVQIKQIGEANPRIQFGNENSGLQMSDGIVVPDVRFYRFGSKRWGFGDDNALDYIASVAANAGNTTVRQTVRGEANARYVRRLNGKQSWGPGGASTQDTNQYRSRVNGIASSPIYFDNAGVDENWFALSLMNGWTGNGAGAPLLQARRLASPPNCLQVSGEITNGTRVDNTIIAAFGAAYFPANRQVIPIGCSPTPATGGFNPMLQLDLAGNLRCFGCNGPANVTLYINGTFALDS